MILYLRNTQVWSSLPPIPIVKSGSHAGFVTFPNGANGVLISGGGDSSSYFLDLDTLIWQPKSSLPLAIYIGASVPYLDSFLIVGGHIDGQTSDLNTIYYYNPSVDDWEVIGTMSIGRRALTAFMVPESFANCS